MQSCISFLSAIGRIEMTFLARHGKTKINTMRIIAELPHPEFKVSILNMNSKYIIKIEQGNLEQAYKIAEADLLDGVNSIFEFLDEEFLKTVSARFAEMRKDYKEAYSRYNY